MAAAKITRWARDGLVALHADMVRAPVLRMPPMSRPHALRWLPHGMVLTLALVLITGQFPLKEEYEVARALAFVLAGGQCAAVALALYRPMAGWWLSMATNVITAEAVFPPPDSAEPWPWTLAALFGHTAVQLLLSLRVRTRVTVETLTAAVLLTGMLEGQGAGYAYSRSAVWAMFLFTVAAVVGASLHGRREAREQVVAQATLTAEERARRALLEERSRIARELHDVVAHHMSVISIQAEAAPYRVQDPPQELTKSFAVIRTNAVDALAELRRVLGVLRSEENGGRATGTSPDAPQPSLERLDELVANVRTAGMDVRATVTGTAHPLPQGVELSAYRIVQEALSNALRHAPGSRVRVEVAYGATGARGDDGIRVSVVNSAPPPGEQAGAGPPAGPPAGAPAGPPDAGSLGAGQGILGMRERTTMLGGAFTAGPARDGGFEVVAFLPRSPEAAPEAAPEAPGTASEGEPG